MGRVTRLRRYRVGRDLTASALTGEDGWLEGRQVLRPGGEIVLVGLPLPLGSEERRARVESWSVVELGRDGTVFAGQCRWLESAGERADGPDEGDSAKAACGHIPAWHQS